MRPLLELKLNNTKNQYTFTLLLLYEMYISAVKWLSQNKSFIPASTFD